MVSMVRILSGLSVLGSGTDYKYNKSIPNLQAPPAPGLLSFQDLGGFD